MTISRAINHLLMAGMELRHRSKTGETYYLGWPGRSGTLRVSNHIGNHGADREIYARITIREESMPLNEVNFMKRVAAALGHYLLRAPITETQKGPGSAL